jgi:hypothetical protein
MHGWQVVTSGGEKVGRVAAVLDDYVVVQQGHLHKTKHPIPKRFAHLREADETVCLTLPKSMVDDSPAMDGDEFDDQRVAEHFGLVGHSVGVATEGEGETEWDDPRYGTDRDSDAAGLVHADRLRASIRTHKRHERFPSSPSFLGDRKRNNAKGR